MEVEIVPGNGWHGIIESTEKNRKIFTYQHNTDSSKILRIKY